MKPRQQSERTPELLAPAGHIESFLAAIDNGADAVYLGLKQLSARALATNFTLDELAWMIPFAEQNGVAVHVALNSLITAGEHREVLDLLQGLSDLRPAALIVQDAGLFRLCRERFPHLPLHASTLMTAHNRLGVRALAAMGAKRVVLARELSFEEIASICRETPIQLEIFVHGALCFSYSGLCLASSYRGGHSGLQGHCVQPCRLPYRQGRKRGHYLSCNDFSALEWLPRLLTLPLAAYKIEGRMKDAEYIGQVVRAYRRVLDAAPEAREAAVAEARQGIAQAPARRLCAGHLAGPDRAMVLSPHRSGSSGLWVGTVQQPGGTEGIAVRLRHRLRLGDRLRSESQQGREGESFTVSEIRSGAGASVPEAEPGGTVVLGKTPALRSGDRLFRVGGKRQDPNALFARIRKSVVRPRSYQRFPDKRQAAPAAERKERVPRGREAGPETEAVWIKLADPRDLAAAFQSPAQRVLLTATKRNLEKLAGEKPAPNRWQRFCWSLPPIIAEKDCGYYEKAVAWYAQRGCLQWELNNWGHFSLVASLPRPRLIAGPRLNLRNLEALAMAAELGCRHAVLSLEITLEELRTLAAFDPGLGLVLCVYCWPPLHFSRLRPKLEEGVPVTSPRGELYRIRYHDGCTQLYADRPVSWLDHLDALHELGYRRFLADLSDGPEPQGRFLPRLLEGYRRRHSPTAADLFNLQRRPLPERR